MISTKFGNGNGYGLIGANDREFVSSLATRVIEIKNQEVIGFQGTYDEYLSSQKKDLKVA